MYEVFLADSRVEKELDTIPTWMRGRVEKVLLDLEAEPRPQGARMLSGQLRGSYRVRAGDWRIIFDIDDDVQKVYVLAIRHRRSAYR